MKVAMMFLVFVFSLFTITASAAPIAGNDYGVHECTYDFAKQGGAIGVVDICGAKKLSPGVIIEGAFYMVTSALTSGGSAQVAFGNASVNNQFMNFTAYNAGALAISTPAGMVSGTPMYVSSTATGTPAVTISGAALTGGKIKLMFKTFKPRQ